MSEQNRSGQIQLRDAALAELLRGQVLSGFEIGEPVGSGGMGTVFQATQLSVNRPVAVKVVRDDDDETTRERFFREARLISSINHPNLVQLIDFGVRPDIGIMYYAMELIEGWSLSDLLRRGRLHPNLAIELAIQICSGLAEAHSQGVVHRDLKASNMLVSLMADSSLRLRLLDFGIARSFEDTENLTQAGMICGTPTYMAPEQALGHPLTAQTDLYALGINLFYMMVGKLPFRAENSVTVVLMQLNESPPSLGPYVEAGHLPPDLAELCMSLLAKDPTARPSSAAAVRSALVALREKLGWGSFFVREPTEAALFDLISPRLSPRSGEPNASWVSPNVGGHTPAPASSPSSSSELAPLAGQSGPVLQRSGGGWEAFNETSPAPEGAKQELVLSPVTGEFMSVGPGETLPAAGEPGGPPIPKAEPQPATRPAAGRRFTSEELVVDRPPPQQPVEQPPPPAENEWGKFILVAIAAFLVFAGIVFAATSDDHRSAVDPPYVEPETVDPEPPPKAERKRPRKKTKTAKAAQKPIELFENMKEDAPDKPPIIIEEAP